MKKIVTFFLLALTVSAEAQESDEVRYQRCLALTETRGQSAFDEAWRWKEAGGGAPAEHCAALALITLKHYRDGAANLDELSLNSSLDAGLRAEISGQAGSAWLMAGDPQNAEKSLSRSLAINPSDTEVRVDRAVARGKLKNWQGADEDLSAVLDNYPNRIDLLLLRASARHARQALAGAWSDIEKVLSARPNDPAALLERGAMRFETGDAAGARIDWQNIIQVAPQSPEAESAKRQLQAVAAKTPPSKPASQAKPAGKPTQAKSAVKTTSTIPKPPPAKSKAKPKRRPILRLPQFQTPQEYGSGPIE